MNDLDIEALMVPDGYRLRATFGGQEILAEGSTAAAALRDTATRIERIEHGADGEQEGGSA